MKTPQDSGSGRSLLDKLGVRPGMRVALVEFEDDNFEAEATKRGAEVSPLQPGLDMVFYRATSPSALGRIAELRTYIRNDGAIWVLRSKGADRTVREVDIIDAGRAFGLVDNKIASFSDTLAAMRLVVPLSLRR